MEIPWNASKPRQRQQVPGTGGEASATGAWHLMEIPGTLANRVSGNRCLAPEGNPWNASKPTQRQQVQQVPGT